MQALSNYIEVGVEQVCVDPQRHRWVFVSEHARHGQHVDASTDGQRCTRVPQVMWRHLLHTGSLRRQGQPAVRAFRTLQIHAIAVSEHRIVGSLALALHR